MPGNAQIAPFDDFRNAPAYYADKARAGDPAAQFYLGLALENLGPEAEARWGSARDWIARAAAGGLPEAKFRLAQIALAKGDVDAARPNLAAAANAGLVEAMFNLGLLEARAGNAAAAERHYLAAALKGYGPAQFNLALARIDRNDENGAVEALAWLMLAARSETPNAAEARDMLQENLSPEARQRAEKLATELTR